MSRAENPEAYARQVQAAVLERTQLRCSVGIGDTLVRAKVATGFGKPGGVFRLTAGNWLDVMGSRPAKDLWGVGTKVSGRLAKLLDVQCAGTPTGNAPSTVRACE